MSDARIAKLQATIAAREGKVGYARNLVALKAELSKLQVAQAAEKAKPASPIATPEKSVETPSLTADGSAA